MKQVSLFVKSGSISTFFFFFLTFFRLCSSMLSIIPDSIRTSTFFTFFKLGSSVSSIIPGSTFFF